MQRSYWLETIDLARQDCGAPERVLTGKKNKGFILLEPPQSNGMIKVDGLLSRVAIFNARGRKSVVLSLLASTKNSSKRD
jgi:hypothetical protein